MRRIPLTAALVLFAAAAPAAAQQMPSHAFLNMPRPTTLSITAEGRVMRAPDVVQLSGGVVTTAPTAAAAMAENNKLMTAVVAAVRKSGIADRDIQTSNLSLQPQYRYENNQPPVLTGYQASNTVNLKVRKIASAGALIDALVTNGANQIQGPNFSLDKPEAALDEARTAAVATARARAELYAKAAGMRVKRIVEIGESGSMMPQPQRMMRMAADEASAAPPVEGGEVGLVINVNVTFELE
ncbi:SIMPL domain-containing protein [Polymorphobacter sp.]|uniref:SIMPL domain-containing protein n=1 Tax=Polymorphobacter sp. TaxID=1909290 RepID=UPI003F71F816